MKITIAGYGFVGKAHVEHFSPYYETVFADPAVNQKTVKEVLGDSVGVICCVSTPQANDGSCDISNVFSVIEETPVNVPVLIRSTITPEGWDYLRQHFPNHNLTFCPEFLREKSFSRDFIINQTLYMGGDGVQFWHDLFIKVMQSLRVGEVDPRVLCAGKYFRNAFLALKVSMFNQIFDYCQAKDIDYDLTAQLIGADNRIGGSHTAITKERGWGGHCFPKDVSAVIKSAESANVSLSILEEVVRYNNSIRKNTTNK